jgi:endonuclease-3 related protein
VAGLRVSSIYSRLLSAYGRQGWWPLLSRSGAQGYDQGGYRLKDNPRYEESAFPPEPEGRFEIAVGAILTQNTAWTNVEKAMTVMVERDHLCPRMILRADLETLADAIRPAGYFNQKAKKLKIFAEAFIEGDWGRKQPARESVLGLWGVGPETADSILLYAYGKPTFVIDAYTRRLYSRLQGIEPPDYSELQGIFSRGLESLCGTGRGKALVYAECHALIVEQAKRHCASKPRCPGCPLAGSCAFSRSATPEQSTPPQRTLTQ